MQQLIGMTLNDINGTVQGNHVMAWSNIHGLDWIQEDMDSCTKIGLWVQHKI